VICIGGAQGRMEFCTKEIVLDWVLKNEGLLREKNDVAQWYSDFFLKNMFLSTTESDLAKA
jgi:hypothetical protein